MEFYPYLRYVLPIFWIVIATIVALLLYRTSSAVVENVVHEEKAQKRVRLVGSVAIAVVVFVLLWRATPSVNVAPDDRIVEAAELRRLASAKQEYDLALNRLDACSRITVVAQCGAELTEMRGARNQFDRLYAEIIGTREPPQ
jgi:hypothetical protein